MHADQVLATTNAGKDASRTSVILQPDMRGRLGRAFLEGLLATLRHEARYLVLDTGAELLGSDGAFHRAALGLADHVLLVASRFHHARVEIEWALGIGTAARDPWFG